MIICNAIQKGGVGKTTSTVFLAQFFAYIKDMKTIVVDSDPQANATRALLGPNIEDTIPSLKEIIIDREHPDKVIRHAKTNNLDVLPAHKDSLYTLEHYLASQPTGNYMLRDVIEDYKLHSKYQMIFIDTPPNLGPFTIGALVAARYVLIPLESEVFSADAFNAFYTTFLKTKKRLNPDLDILGAFLNKFEQRTILSKDIVTAYKKTLGDILMESLVRVNVSIRESIAKGATLYTYAPRSNGAQDFAALGDEVLARLIEKGNLIPEGVA